MFIQPIDTTSLGTAVGSTTGTATKNNMDPAASQDRFLKLLVAQLNNQDPLNPMQNAELTSQLAQMSTVTGIEKLNTTLSGLVNQTGANQLAGSGVRINAVAPSIAMHAFLAKVTTDDLLAELSAKEAFGRPAEVWEVANVMIFLASDLSSYMTGEIVSVSSQR
eukprot:gene17171-35524_t